MASSSCVPTLTTTQVSTSQSLVTASTQSVSIGPSSVSAVVLRTCARSDGRCQPTLETSFITFPGSPTTVTVLATLTVDVPVTVLTTLFGPSCPTPSVSTSSSTSSTTPIPVITTPSSTIITTNSLVTSNGSTFLSFYTSTSTYAAVTVGAQSTDSSSESRVAVGPIVGGIVGGLVVLLLFGLLIWRLVSKKSKYGNFFTNKDGLHKDEKQPYKYGMVRRLSFNPASLEPSSPAVQNAFGSDGGNGQVQGGILSNDAGLSYPAVGGQPQGALGRSPTSSYGNDGGALGRNLSANHNTVGNLSPIAHTSDFSRIPLLGTAAATTPSRPSSSRPSTGSSSHAPFGPLVTPAIHQGGYPPALQNWNATWNANHEYADPSTPSNINTPWTTSDDGNGSVGGVSPILSPIGRSSSQYQHYQQHQRSRVASNNTNYEYHQSYVEMDSPHPSSFSQEAPSYDEQGRPLNNIPPEKPPLVHLDGALYQQPRASSSSGNEPPAYIE